MRVFVSIVMASLVLAAPATAQQAKPSIDLELNAAEKTDKGCRLTFVVKNDIGKALARAGFEMALFNSAGVVDRLSVLEFKSLPAGKTKVTRFELAGVDCMGISRILVNTAGACEGEGVDASSCMNALSVSSKTDIAFGL